MMIPSEEKICSTKTDLLEQITGLLAGRVAEEVVLVVNNKRRKRCRRDRIINWKAVEEKSKERIKK